MNCARESVGSNVILYTRKTSWRIVLADDTIGRVCLKVSYPFKPHFCIIRCFVFCSSLEFALNSKRTHQTETRPTLQCRGKEIPVKKHSILRATIETSSSVDYLLNLSILLSRGNERNFDVFSSGERTRQEPKIKILTTYVVKNCSLMKRF